MEAIYCMCCKSYIRVTEAAIIFKHGFYKSTPVGVCSQCIPLIKDDKQPA